MSEKTLQVGSATRQIWNGRSHASPYSRPGTPGTVSPGAAPDLWSPPSGFPRISHAEATPEPGPRTDPKPATSRLAQPGRSAGPAGASGRLSPRGRASRRPRPPARAPGPAPHPAGPAPAHLALADAEDAAAAAQAYAGAVGPRGGAAEGEGAARGAQPLHRGAHERGRSAPPARPQVEVAQRDEHDRPASGGARSPDARTTGSPLPPGPAPRPPSRGPEEAAP